MKKGTKGTKICKYKNCENEFYLSRSDKKYCCRSCKEKSRKNYRYYNEVGYKKLKKDNED